MDPITLGLGAVSLGSTIFSAIKGGSANKANEDLLAQQEESNEAFYNNNRNFMDTNLAKSVLERARKQYEDRGKISDSKAEVTGASAEQVVAEKSAANEGYNDIVRNLAETGTRYTQNNDFQYRNNLNRLLSARMGLNQNKAESASNAASNAAGLLGSAAMLGGFGAESGVERNQFGRTAEQETAVQRIAKSV